MSVLTDANSGITQLGVSKTVYTFNTIEAEEIAMLSSQTDCYKQFTSGYLIKYLNKNISSIRYNVLNLPNLVSFTGGNSVEHHYGADGVHKIGATTLTTDYCGNMVYENGMLEMLLNEAGYVSFPDKKVHFYLRELLGLWKRY